MIDAWLAEHRGWAREGETLAKSFRFADFASALAFTVKLGLVSEKRDHHPDVHLGWGKAKVVWTTHDRGGITELDLALAEATDELSRGA